MQWVHAAIPRPDYRKTRHPLQVVTLLSILLHAVTYERDGGSEFVGIGGHMAAIPRILVVDDDADVRQMTTQFLRQHGTIALPAATEAEVRKHLDAGRVDLILLDVMLGDENGLEICRHLRAEQDVPIIMVSALSADHQRMAGYEVGADDYIAKPFNPELLLARAKAVLSRARRSSSLVHRRKTMVFHFNGWRYDAKRDEVLSPDGIQVALSRRETALLQALLSNPHIPLTREEIAAAFDVTGTAAPSGEALGRSIDVLVGRLRSKIEANPKDPTMLRTERGVGYVLAVDVVAEDA
jgi:two-component system OmpR family response regulator